MQGGYGAENPMDADVQTMTMQLKPQIEAKMGKAFPVFVPISYKTQVVAGINYQVRIGVADGKSLCVIINEQLPCAGGAKSLTDAKWM